MYRVSMFSTTNSGRFATIKANPTHNDEEKVHYHDLRRKDKLQEKPLTNKLEKIASKSKHVQG